MFFLNVLFGPFIWSVCLVFALLTSSFTAKYKIGRIMQNIWHKEERSNRTDYCENPHPHWTEWKQHHIWLGEMKTHHTKHKGIFVCSLSLQSRAKATQQLEKKKLWRLQLKETIKLIKKQHRQDTEVDFLNMAFKTADKRNQLLHEHEGLRDLQSFIYVEDISDLIRPYHVFNWITGTKQETSL